MAEMAGGTEEAEEAEGTWAETLRPQYLTRNDTSHIDVLVKYRRSITVTISY